MPDPTAAATLERVVDPATPGDSFRAIFDAHAREVYRFLRRLLDDHETAEDALQETFVRLHRALPTVDKDRPLAPFVLQIARNVAIDIVRARQKKPKSVGLEPDAVLAPDATGTAEKTELVNAALAALSPEHRAVVVLRHMHGLKLDDVASALGCTVRTAYNRLRAASVLLARELERRGLASGEVRS
jgi:RNA polymerase sigma-70 factor (ECF subfamily)